METCVHHSKHMIITFIHSIFPSAILPRHGDVKWIIMGMLVGWVGVKSPGYAGHFEGGDQPYPANRYGGSWVGLTL